MSSSSRSTGDRLGEILLRQGAIDEAQLARALAEQAGLPLWEPCEADAAVVLDLPQDLARGLPALPFRRDPTGAVHVAIVDPSDTEALSNLEALLGRDLAFHVALPDQLLEALDRAYAGSTAKAAPPVQQRDEPIPAGILADLAVLAEDDDGPGASLTMESPGARPLKVYDASATTLPTEGMRAEPAPVEASRAEAERAPRMASRQEQVPEAAPGLAGLSPSLGSRRSVPAEGSHAGPMHTELIINEGHGGEIPALLATLAADSPGGAFDAFLGALVSRALAWRASVIELITSGDATRLRYRVDGSWQGALMLPRWAGDGLGAALDRHVLASHNPEPRVRVGRIPARRGERSLELLVRSETRGDRRRRTVRILDPKTQTSTSQLGLPPDVARRIRQWTAGREGLVLVCSPNDGGRSTTLYAIARDLARSRPTVVLDRFVASPVAGATLIALDEDGPHNLTEALPAALTAEPRCIVADRVGGGSELSALLGLAARGMLVVLGVEGADAHAALTTLRKRGVPDILLGPQILGIVEQRLLRLLCPHCGTREPLDPVLASALGLVVETMPPDVPVAGPGCAHCHHSGFVGRAPLFTRVELSAGVSPGISDDELRAHVDANRPTSAPALALPLLAKGRTSLREIGRVVGVRNASSATAPQAVPLVSVMSPEWSGSVTGDQTMAGPMESGEESISLDGLADGMPDTDDRFRILVLESQDSVGPLLATQLPPGEYRIVVGDDLEQSLRLAGEEHPAALVLGTTQRDQPLEWIEALRARPECTFLPLVVVDDNSGLDPMDLLVAGADEVIQASAAAQLGAGLRALLHRVG